MAGSRILSGGARPVNPSDVVLALAGWLFVSTWVGLLYVIIVRGRRRG